MHDKPEPNSAPTGKASLPAVFVRNPRARRYILRLDKNGRARVTIPRLGNAAEALAFLERNSGWLEHQLKLSAARRSVSDLSVGAPILFRGVAVPLELVSVPRPALCLAGHNFPIPAAAVEAPELWRPILQFRLRALAARELPPRVYQLAAENTLSVQRVSVRNQRSRWGSCSSRGVISLNWRLIHAPPSVADYLILHELAHLRHMNHSARFWRELRMMCSTVEESEAWLKANSRLIHF